MSNNIGMSNSPKGESQFKVGEILGFVFTFLLVLVFYILLCAIPFGVDFFFRGSKWFAFIASILVMPVWVRIIRPGPGILTGAVSLGGLFGLGGLALHWLALLNSD